MKCPFPGLRGESTALGDMHLEDQGKVVFCNISGISLKEIAKNWEGKIALLWNFKVSEWCMNYLAVYKKNCAFSCHGTASCIVFIGNKMVL